MNLKLPVYVLITLLQLQSHSCENRNIIHYQAIPKELWLIIIKHMESKRNILSAASFFYKVHQNLNEKKSIGHCKKLAHKHILHNKYDAHATTDNFSPNIFTPTFREKLLSNYDDYFALFFLKYGHKDKMYKEFVISHPVLKEKIDIESRKYFANIPCSHTVYSLKNKKEEGIIIKCRKNLTESMLNNLLNEYKNEKIVRILLPKNENFPFGVNIHMNKNLCPIIIQLRDGTTPLHYCMNSFTREENFENAKFLIVNGADLEFPNTAGFTPLCFSLLNKKTLKLFDVLLKNGANPNAKSAKTCGTRTPLEFCTHYAPEKRKLLLKYGAKEKKKAKQNKDFIKDYEKNKNCFLLNFDQLLGD